MLPAANLPTTLLRQSNVASVSRAHVSRCIRPAAAAVLAISWHRRPPGGPVLCADAGNPAAMHLLRRRFLQQARHANGGTCSVNRAEVHVSAGLGHYCLLTSSWHPRASMRTAAIAKSRHAISMASVSTPRTAGKPGGRSVSRRPAINGRRLARARCGRSRAAESWRPRTSRRASRPQVDGIAAAGAQGLLHKRRQQAGILA